VVARTSRHFLLFLLCLFLTLGLSRPSASGAFSVAPGAFSVAEVKPHYQCTEPEGQDRVRDHVAQLASGSTGIIALIQFEFTLQEPDGYTVFGSSCTQRTSDPVVVLVDEKQFSVISGIGETTVGNYSAVPFLQTGKQLPGSMCVADPNVYGQRGYTGAVLQHLASGREICVVAATFPHCRGAWRPDFVKSIAQSCAGHELLVIADTNAACEAEGPAASKGEPMQVIGEYHGAAWGKCSDPAVDSDEPTCCHDLSKGHPEARYWYDRIALCGGGSVDNFTVNRDFLCGADEEHKSTSAWVHLPSDDVMIVSV